MTPKRQLRKNTPSLYNTLYTTNSPQTASSPPDSAPAYPDSLSNGSETLITLSSAPNPPPTPSACMLTSRPESRLAAIAPAALDRMRAGRSGSSSSSSSSCRCHCSRRKRRLRRRRQRRRRAGSRARGRLRWLRRRLDLNRGSVACAASDAAFCVGRRGLVLAYCLHGGRGCGEGELKWVGGEHVSITLSVDG